MFDRVALPRVLPFFVYLLFIFVADMLARLGVGEAQLRYLYPVKIVVVLALLVYYRRHYVELINAAPLGWRQAAIAVVGGIVVLVLWVNLDAGWMAVGTSAGFDPRDAGQVNWPMVLVRIAGAALVVPVMEELFWRSFLLRWLDTPEFLAADPAKIRLRSVIITAILFGFEHNLWLAGIVAGLAYSWLFRRSQTLWSPILAHGVTNGLLGVWIVLNEKWTYW